MCPSLEQCGADAFAGAAGCWLPACSFKQRFSFSSSFFFFLKCSRLSSLYQSVSLHLKVSLPHSPSPTAKNICQFRHCFHQSHLRTRLSLVMNIFLNEFPIALVIRAKCSGCLGSVCPRLHLCFLSQRRSWSVSARTLAEHVLVGVN